MAEEPGDEYVTLAATCDALNDSKFKFRSANTYCSGCLPLDSFTITLSHLDAATCISSCVSGSLIKNESPYFNVLRNILNILRFQSLIVVNCFTASFNISASVSVGSALNSISNGVPVFLLFCVQNSAMISSAALTSES